MYGYYCKHRGLIILFEAWPNPYRKATQLREQLLKDGLQICRTGTETSRGRTWAASLWTGKNAETIAAQLPKPKSHGSLTVGQNINWNW